MQTDSLFKPTIITDVCYIKHKGKRSDFHGKTHAHGPKYHEIVYVDYGKTIVKINDSDFILNSGECIFIHGGFKHSFTGEHGIPFDFLNITLHGKIPEELFSKKIIINRKCHELMESLKKEASQNLPYAEDLIICNLTELVIYLYRQVSSCVPSNLPDTENLYRYQSEIVRRAISLIKNDYAKNLSLNKLSRAVGVSESYLSALLKKELSENFSSILQKQRISVAKHLLRESDYTLREIASFIGYSSMPFFFKIFKRMVGMTPKYYIKSLGEPTENE